MVLLLIIELFFHEFRIVQELHPNYPMANSFTTAVAYTSDHQVVAAWACPAEAADSNQGTMDSACRP